MSATPMPVTGTAIKRAIESRDGRMLASFYADDAELSIVDRDNPPSRPRVIKGRAAIDAYWDDICGRAMTHRVETTVVEGNRLAFTQACSYLAGGKVLALSLLELRDGRIARQIAVQAWDE
jgi:ketosteroid isomerase-like protein